MPDIDPMLEDFIAETRDNLDIIESDILLIEKNPRDRGVVDRAFRAAHTIKGSCGFFKLPRIAAAAHRLETVMDAWRDGRVLPARDSIADAMAETGRLRLLAGHLAALGHEPAVDDDVVAGAEGDKSIRIRVDVLEDLMTAAGELTLARNQLSDMARLRGYDDLVTPLQRLGQTASAVQHSVSAARLQPVARAWGHLPRLVYETATQLGRMVRLNMTGGAVEIDRQLLDAVRDPLTQMIRNAVAHGIETPDERIRAGKPDTGTISVTARHDAGYIVIDVADDGRGIDAAQVRARAEELGMADATEARADIAGILFTPGFTTADSVSDMAGRGVGLDVVRRNIEKVGGSISMESEAGRGTVFSVRVPLTLAVMSALVVSSGGRRYALPQSAVREMVRAEVEICGGARLLRLRGKSMPLLGFPVSTADERHAVVVEDAGRVFAIPVSATAETMEIIVKPLPSVFRALRLFSGVTIMADGQPVPIADIAAIADQGGVIAEDIAQAPAAPVTRTVDMLMFACGDRRYALPLSEVRRVEKIPAVAIERAGTGYATQVCGRLMPLVMMTGMADTDMHDVVVIGDMHGAAVAGLCVSRVLDIVAHEAAAGVCGSVVMAGCVVDIVESADFLSSSTEKHRVLMVDDSPFFKTIIQPVLQSAGYDVVFAHGAEEALARCSAGEEFDVILSDIEMPGMNGLEFASRVRGSDWRRTPLLALSAHATALDVRRGRAAGFDEYITKFDRDSLLSTLARAAGGVRG
jgi:two-component system chemotaxis sensor kinase CheA